MLRKKLSDRIFFRTIFTTIGLRPMDWDLQPFVPYFQYEIGPYRTDYLLHFRRQPNWDLYKNEILNKVSEYTGYDIARYLNFHYETYADKADFLRFLRYEADERVRQLGRRMLDWRIKMEMVLAWVAEQERALDGPAADPEPGVVTASLVEPAPVVQRAAPSKEKREEAVEEDAGQDGQISTGGIALSDPRNLDRIIQLFLLLKDVTAPGQPRWPLFRRMKQNDIGSIMAQFETFRGRKANTIEKRISKCREDLRPNNPKTIQLVKALTEFFY